MRKSRSNRKYEGREKGSGDIKVRRKVDKLILV